MRLLAALFAEGMSVAYADGNLPLKIGESEIDAPVTAKSGAQQTKERLVLIDGQQLAVAHRPTLRRKIETHDSDFREKWFCHGVLLHQVTSILFYQPVWPVGLASERQPLETWKDRT